MEKNYLSATLKPNKTNFKGHILTSNEKGEKEYQFYLPVSDSNKAGIEVLALNDRGEVVKNLTDAVKASKKDDKLPIWTLPTASLDDEKTRVAFRFFYDWNKVTDNTLKAKVGTEDFNEAIFQTRPALTMSRQIYHMFPDSWTNGEIQTDEYGHEVQRNHFNKFGGTIKKIIEGLDDIKALGVTRILSTPMFGDDTVSSHAYWTVDSQQVTSTLGNMNDYKKLRLELFKRGMGHIADVSLANEGVEGLHIQDIVRWGKKSRYLKWFDIKDFDMNGLRFGVLPRMDSEAEKHYDFKFVNSPLIYEFDKSGKPTDNFGKVNPHYDRTQPTYLQQFDRRLMDENYINSPELLKANTKKQCEDVNEIRDYKDSLQPFKFDVDPAEAEAKIKEMKKIKVTESSPNHSVYRNMLQKWENFSLEPYDKEGTIRNWVGKKDIFGLNYKNPEVQDFALGIPKYWANDSDKFYTTIISKMLAQAKDGDEKSTVIQSIAKAFEVDLSDEELKNISEGTYLSELAPVHDSILDELKDFPINAAETPREISSLITDPDVKSSKELHSAFEKHIAPMVENIFKTTHPEAFENGKLTESGKHSFRLVSNDIMRYVTGYVLSGENPTVKEDEGVIQIDLPKDFHKKVFNNLEYQSSTRQEAIDKLLMNFDYGAKELSKDSKAKADIKFIIDKSIKGVDLGTIKIAKALMSRLEIGQEWRIDAAKDVIDLDLIKQGKADINTLWGVCQNFWSKFVKVARTYNPKAYIIGEVTNLNDYFGNDNAAHVQRELMKKAGFTTPTQYAQVFNILSQIVHGAPEETAKYHSSLNGLMKDLGEFFQSGFADNIKSAHENLGNQDKPRPLHGYSININDFYNWDKFNVNPVRDALNESVDFVLHNENLISKEQADIIMKSFDDYSRGVVSKRATEHFELKPFNIDIDEALKRANLGFDKAKLEKLSGAIHNIMMPPGFFKYESVLQILVSLPGSPTIYSGDEYGETGFESPGNNTYVHNRNQIHKSWVNDPNRPEFKKFNDTLKKTFNMRHREEFSPFVNGDTVLLGNLAGENVAGVYRYNKDRDVIALFNTNGFGNERNAYPRYNSPDECSKVRASILPIDIKRNAGFDMSNAYGTDKFLRIDKSGNTVRDGFYKIADGLLKRFDDEACTKLSSNDGHIDLQDVATYFVRDVVTKSKGYAKKEVPSLSQVMRGMFMAKL